MNRLTVKILFNFRTKLILPGAYTGLGKTFNWIIFETDD